MSKDRKKVLHIHSNVNDKQPTPTTLEYGELGVNYASGNTFISTKNSNDEVVRFSEDETIINWMEMKEVFPYEGYVRDRLGTPISYSSGTISTQDLLDNKSNIIIKINQVAAENSIYDEKINGAKDIYGNAINPISSDGYRDGAGFAIDMSPYAMIGANPSFSSVTVDCRTELNGTTIINGEQGDCGSKFEVNVKDICIQSNDKLNEYGVNESNFGTSCDGTKVSKSTTIKGDNISIDSTRTGVYNSISLNACDNISSNTNSFNIVECNDGDGEVVIDTTNITINTENYDLNGDEICISGTTRANLYGGVTNIGVDCDGTTADTVNISASTIHQGGDTFIQDFHDYIINVEAYEINGDNVCISGSSKTNIYGPETNIGIECSDLTASTVNISGTTVNEGGTNLNQEFANYSGDITNYTLNTDEYDLNGDEICISGATRANIYGGETNIGVDCDGTTANTVNVSGATINEGGTSINQEFNNYSGDVTDYTLNTENYDLNGDKICISGTTKANVYGGETNIGIDCDGTTAGTINVSGTTINEGGTTINISGETTNIASDSDINIEGDDICIIGETEVSLGASEVNVGTNCSGTPISNITNIYGDTINNVSEHYNISGDTTIVGDTVISGETTITDTLNLENGLSKTLSWTYGDVKNESACTSGDSTNFKDDKCFTIPRCVGDMNRRTLSWSNGAANEGSYDPGASCDNTASGDNIVIPSQLSHLTDWSSDCLSIPNNVCVSGTVTATGGMYTSSDRELKDNISFIGSRDISMVKRIELKSFNYKSDPSNRTMYGVIAQDLEEIGLDNLVQYDENGNRAVDYTGFLILKIAQLEKEVSLLRILLEQKDKD